MVAGFIHPDTGEKIFHTQLGQNAILNRRSVDAHEFGRHGASESYCLKNRTVSVHFGPAEGGFDIDLLVHWKVYFQDLDDTAETPERKAAEERALKPSA